MKGKKSLWSFFLTLVLVVVVAGCGGKEHSNAKTEDFSEADRIAYEYIAATVEQDDERMLAILTTEGEEYATNAHLLKTNEHLHPGNEELMGDSYEIIRYDSYVENEELYYKVKYKLPNNKLTRGDAEYLKVVKDESGTWGLTKPLGISKSERERLFPEGKGLESGVLLHKYQDE